MAHAIVARGERLERGFVAATVRCSDCAYVTITGGKRGRDWSQAIDDHLAQHEPGRALDIDVDWEPVAHCSVCPDGIGDITTADEGLECQDCGTRWDIDGRGGETT